jgi:hypothetical protein
VGDSRASRAHFFRMARASALSLLAFSAITAKGKGEAPARVTDEMSRSESDVLLFQLRLEQTALSSAFPGFASKDGILLPLGELCRLLDLAIQVDAVHGKADGFFIREDRRFNLDVASGKLNVDGKSLNFDRSQVEQHEDDLYVDSRLISAWLPIDISIDSRSAAITLSTREFLPIQERWKREKLAGRLGGAAAEPVKYDSIPNPYRAADIPMFDETLRLTGRSRSTPGTSQIQAQSVTFASGDLFGLSANAYTILDSREGFREFRATLGRRDPSARLLGPLHATEFSFGEVLSPGLGLVALPYAGTGALLSNFPLARADRFDRHSFRGNLPPGWQVELYRNQSLLAFQGSRADGTYEFLDIPLYYGWNDFKLVFYGPQGQRREEAAHFDVSESQTPEGTLQYRLAGNDPRIAGKRGQLEGRYGINKNMSTTFALASVDFEGFRHTYTQLGLQGFWKPLSSSLLAVRDSRGGSVVELGARTRIGSVSLGARQDELSGGFTSEIFRPLYGLIKRRSTLEANAVLPSFDRAWFTVDAGFSQDGLVSGGHINRLFTRLSTSYSGYFVSNQITRTQARETPVPFEASTLGDFLISKFYRSLSIRGQVSYTLAPTHEINTLGLTAEMPAFDGWLMRAGLLRALKTSDTQIQLGANKAQGTYGLGAELTYSTINKWSADLTLRVGLGREPRSKRWQAQAQSMASFGAASVRVFLDQNGNGVWDPGEPAVPHAGFLVNGATHPAVTDDQGQAFLSNLSAEVEANLAVSTATLEDPLMRPSRDGVRFTPRPGHVVSVDFPVLVLGEVTGTSYLRDENTSRELPGLKLEVLDANFKIVKRARSAFDGFFDLTDLAPGAYVMRVAFEETERLGIELPTPKTFRIESNGTVIDGLDLILRPVSAAEFSKPKPLTPTPH